MRKSRDLVSSGHSESLLHQPQNRRFPNASILPPIKNATTVPDGQKALAQQRRRSLNKDAVVDEDFSMLLSLQNGTAAATSKNNQSMMTAASNRSKRPLIEHEFNDEDDDESDEYANDDKQGNFCCHKKLSNDDKMIICGSEMMEVVEVMRVKKNYENLIGADADDRRQREQLHWWCQRRESSELPSKIPMAAAAAAAAAADVVDDVDGVMRLVFDSDFDCYFDPSTGQYYRVLPKNKQ
ncbi:unnamed protein product [Anisakis simplex]|uniref:EPL1 domain-containing protein n=1 Tax=Anisakis simplex TaxID=6269 RepID=A0A0M3JV75_ANISI|nr:unnamed protein product [Anisakis simplex]